MSRTPDKDFGNFGPVAVGENRFGFCGKSHHVESLREFLLERYPDSAVSIPTETFEEHLEIVVEFQDGSAIQAAFENWKDWYSSNGRRVLERYDVLSRQYEIDYPGRPRKLRVSPTIAGAFQCCTIEIWEAQNWEPPAELVDQLTDLGNANYLDALRQILAVHDVQEIELVRGAGFDFFEIVPVH